MERAVSTGPEASGKWMASTNHGQSGASRGCTACASAGGKGARLEEAPRGLCGSGLIIFLTAVMVNTRGKTV